MTVNDLIRSLRLEYHDLDEATPLLDAEQLERAIVRALASVNKDLKRSYTVDGDGNISPAFEDDDREVLLLHALVVVCRMMQAKTARGFSFSSGDKKVDKTRQPAYWAELGRSYLSQYQQAVSERNPEYGIGIPVIIPQIYGMD